MALVRDGELGSSELIKSQINFPRSAKNPSAPELTWNRAIKHADRRDACPAALFRFAGGDFPAHVTSDKKLPSSSLQALEPHHA
jgi:hypothetical protein